MGADHRSAQWLCAEHRDLPGHGETAGSPAPLDVIAAQVHALIDSVAAERPVIVGHSMSGGLATLYAATFPSLGVVTIDNGLDIRPFAQLIRRMEPVTIPPLGGHLI